MKRRWRLLLLLAVTLLIFAALFSRVPFPELAGVMAGADLLYLAAAVCVTLPFPLLGAARWGAVLRAMGHEVPFSRRLSLVLGAWPLNAVTPGKTGDLARAYPLRAEVPVPETLGSVVAERVLDVLVLSGIWLAGALAVGARGMVLLAASAILAAWVGLFVLSRNFWGLGNLLLGEKLRGFSEASRALMRSPGFFGRAVLWSGLNWFLSVLQVKLLLSALGGSAGVLQVMASLPPAVFVGLLPVTLAGMGTRDAAVLALFAPYGEPAQLLGVSLLYTVLGYWMFALAGLYFMRRLV